jgi:hypothetical protein
LTLGDHSGLNYGLTVYSNEITAEFNNAQDLYLDIYGYYAEFLYYDVGFRIIADNLTQNEFVETLTSMIK